LVPKTILFNFPPESIPFSSSPKKIYLQDFVPPRPPAAFKPPAFSPYPPMRMAVPVDRIRPKSTGKKFFLTSSTVDTPVNPATATSEDQAMTDRKSTRLNSSHVK